MVRRLKLAGVSLGLALWIILTVCGDLAAESPTLPSAQAPPLLPVAAAISAERAAEPFTLTFFNRPIVVFRAKVVGRSPTERAQGAQRVLDDLVADRTTGPVESRLFEGGGLILVASRGVILLTTADIDELSGETLQGVAGQTVARLQQALAEAEEARRPRALLRSGAFALLALVVGLVVLLGLGWVNRIASNRLIALAEERVTKAGIADLSMLRASRLLDFERHCVTLVIRTADLVVLYGVVSTVLRLFPYTRPWGESMRGFLLQTAKHLGLSVVYAFPGLFTVIVIFAIVHYVTRLVTLWFTAIERGHARTRWIYPDTAQPTRRLVVTLLWLFALVVAYPYMPGNQTEAFKGISVFLGLMVTFGSSGLVNQIMSGFMITYSRALRVGDFVRIGDVEGTVIHLGVLSTKVKTLKNEEVTVPNAVAVSQTTTDYSRFNETEGVFTPTSVTIGYNAPWRQVHSLLLLAAERTPGLRAEPKPLGTAGVPRGLLRQVHPLGLSGAAAVSALHVERPARPHSGSVQRVWRSNHVPELHAGSCGAEGCCEEGLVRRAGAARLAARAVLIFVLSSSRGLMSAAVVVANLFGPVSSLHAQGVEFGPFGGYRFGGDFFELITEQPVDLDGAPAFGVVFDVPLSNGLQVEGFFTHQDAHVSVPARPFGPATRWHVTVDHWQAGGLQEFGGGRARPFLTGSLGLTRYAAEGDSEIRFAFGAGGGVKLFPLSHVGVRLDGRVFGTFVDGDGSLIFCSPGFCLASLDFDVIWQAEFTAGIIVRLR